MKNFMSNSIFKHFKHIITQIFIAIKNAILLYSTQNSVIRYTVNNSILFHAKAAIIQDQLDL